MTDEEKKWRLGVSVSIKDNQVDPSLQITDQIDQSQSLTLKIARDKVAVDYDLQF